VQARVSEARRAGQGWRDVCRETLALTRHVRSPFARSRTRQRECAFAIECNVQSLTEGWRETCRWVVRVAVSKETSLKESNPLLSSRLLHLLPRSVFSFSGRWEAS